MTRLAWGTPGERYYETGVDRGVLFVQGSSGVAWTGLVSVTESPSGGTPKAYYIDGIKYLNVSSFEEFAGTIEAYQAPAEFGPCDGLSHVQYGLFAAHQRRKSFGLAYRTRIGNDVEGPDHGYKLHLIYNALASPSERTNQSMGDSPEPTMLSWEITTLSPPVTGLRPTAHFVVDTRQAPYGLTQDLEDLIYGTPIQQPRLPLPNELITLFNSFLTGIFDAEYYNTDGFATEYDGGAPNTAHTNTIDGGTP